MSFYSGQAVSVGRVSAAMRPKALTYKNTAPPLRAVGAVFQYTQNKEKGQRQMGLAPGQWNERPMAFHSIPEPAKAVDRRRAPQDP
jgi:hypothetical protein